MKYLFVNSVLGYGSTGKLIADTCRNLISEGHDVLVAWGRKKMGCNDIPNLRIGFNGQVYFNILTARLFDNDAFLATKASKAFINKIEEFSPDIVCLHNMHGYYLDMSVLFSYLATHQSIRVEWTLHDCWALTGHCAYFDYVNCNKWRVQCNKCPQRGIYPKSVVFDHSFRNYIRKKKLYKQMPNLHIITPSEWLKKKVEQGILSGLDVEVRNNQVDASTFRPLKKSESFVENYLAQKIGGSGKGFVKIILGVANIWEPRKGLDDFILLANMLGSGYRIVLAGRIRKKIKEYPSNIIFLNHISSKQEMAQIYNSADVFVNMSFEDNYPTTLLEAKACGTPSITYDIGGCGEIVESANVFRRGDFEGIIRRIEELTAKYQRHHA